MFRIVLVIILAAMVQEEELSAQAYHEEFKRNSPRGRSKQSVWIKLYRKLKQKSRTVKKRDPLGQYRNHLNAALTIQTRRRHTSTLPSNCEELRAKCEAAGFSASRGNQKGHSSRTSTRQLSHKILCTEYTPVACITNTTVFSQAQIIYVPVAQELNGSGLQRHHCAHKNSSVIWSAMSSRCCLTFSLPVHHNTKHHLDTTFSKTTLCTEHLFQNLNSRQAAPTNRSRTSIRRVAETRATPLPQVMSLKSLRQFLEVLWKTSYKNTMCMR